MLKLLKDLVKQLPYPIFLRLFHLKYAIGELGQDDFCRRKFHIGSFEEIDLAKWKRSDFLFILGSGASINRISPERWKSIAQHDTIGFNFWPFHPFVPGMYFFEAIRTNTYAGKVFSEIARRRAAEYANSLKVVTDP